MKAKRCPFCDEKPVKVEYPVKRTGYIFSAWVHPDNGCILAGMEVTDDMLLSWNKRGGVE